MCGRGRRCSCAPEFPALSLSSAKREAPSWLHQSQRRSPQKVIQKRHATYSGFIKLVICYYIAQAPSSNSVLITQKRSPDVAPQQSKNFQSNKKELTLKHTVTQILILRSSVICNVHFDFIYSTLCSAQNNSSSPFVGHGGHLPGKSFRSGTAGPFK